jgi:hypothetical protein
MATEHPNDKEMLWILTLFVDGLLTAETAKKKYLTDAEERDKEEGIRKVDLIRRGCNYLVSSGYAEERLAENGDQVTILNENSLEYYHRIKGRIERRMNPEIIEKGWYNGWQLKIVIGGAILILITLLVKMAGCNIETSNLIQKDSRMRVQEQNG